jgi:hypothetical protein
MNNNTNKLKCRNCNGNHLTIKCNHKKKNDNEITIINKINTTEYKKYYKARISELPTDISEKELYELLINWGNIVKIIVKEYENSSSAYITFKNEIEVDYLVKAINSTVFEHRIISVEKLL